MGKMQFLGCQIAIIINTSQFNYNPNNYNPNLQNFYSLNSLPSSFTYNLTQNRTDTKINEQIMSRGRHTCKFTLKNMKRVQCWGTNFHNQSDVPKEISKSATSILQGWTHNCAFINQTQVSCWGDNNQGQADLIPILYSRQITMMSLGARFTCVITEDSFKTCWGMEVDGNLSIPLKYKDTRVQVAGIESGAMHSIILNQDKRIEGFGGNHQGQIEPPENQNVDIRSVSIGVLHSCAVNNSSIVKCWGSNEFEQCDVKKMRYYHTLAWQVQAGWRNSCIINFIGGIICYGTNEQGLIDVPMDFRMSTIMMALGEEHICAKNQENVFKCWGRNENKQLEIPMGLN